MPTTGELALAVDIYNSDASLNSYPLDSPHDIGGHIDKQLLSSDRTFRPEGRTFRPESELQSNRRRHRNFSSIPHDINPPSTCQAQHRPPQSLLSMQNVPKDGGSALALLSRLCTTATTCLSCPLGWVDRALNPANKRAVAGSGVLILFASRPRMGGAVGRRDDQLC